MEIPTFKYNTDPIKLGVIKKELNHCPVCDQEREFYYEVAP